MLRILCGVFHKNICEIPMKWEIRKVYSRSYQGWCEGKTSEAVASGPRILEALLRPKKKLLVWRSSCTRYSWRLHFYAVLPDIQISWALEKSTNFQENTDFFLSNKDFLIWTFLKSDYSMQIFLVKYRFVLFICITHWKHIYIYSWEVELGGFKNLPFFKYYNAPEWESSL